MSYNAVRGSIDLDTCAAVHHRYIPAITRHCLEVYGNPCQQQQQQPAAEEFSPSSSSSHYALDERKVCLHYAMKLLTEKDVWYR